MMFFKEEDIVNCSNEELDEMYTLIAKEKATRATMEYLKKRDDIDVNALLDFLNRIAD